MIAATFGVGQVVYSILWFVLFFVEICAWYFFGRWVGRQERERKRLFPDDF